MASLRIVSMANARDRVNHFLFPIRTTASLFYPCGQLDPTRQWRRHAMMTETDRLLTFFGNDRVDHQARLVTLVSNRNFISHQICHAPAGLIGKGLVLVKG